MTTNDNKRARGVSAAAHREISRLLGELSHLTNSSSSSSSSSPNYRNCLARKQKKTRKR